MEKKEIVLNKTRELYHVLLIKAIDIPFAHKLFSEVYNVILYRHQVQTAKTPEATSLARWSLSDARDRFNDTLGQMNICTMDKDLVRYIAENYEFEEK